MTETLDEVPKVKLDGREYAVPPMNARRIIKFVGLMSGLDMSALAGGQRLMTEDELRRCYEGVYLGIAGGLPKAGETGHVTVDEFLDGNANMAEIIPALFVCMKAAGMRAADPGEAKPAA